MIVPGGRRAWRTVRASTSAEWAPAGPLGQGSLRSSSQCDSPRPSMTRVLIHHRRSLRRSRGGELTGRDSTLTSRAADL
jgi:hypothetical protein